MLAMKASLGNGTRKETFKGEIAKQRKRYETRLGVDGFIYVRVCTCVYLYIFLHVCARICIYIADS